MGARARRESKVKFQSLTTVALIGAVMAMALIAASCASPATLELTPEPTATPSWETHTYTNEEWGFAFSLATPIDWLPTGLIGEHQIGGWYDPSYPMPPNASAVWCYWITCNPPRAGTELPEDPIILASSQKRFAVRQELGEWSYHLMFVSPEDIFAQVKPVFNRIMDSFTPLSLEEAE